MKESTVYKETDLPCFLMFSELKEKSQSPLIELQGALVNITFLRQKQGWKKYTSTLAHPPPTFAHPPPVPLSNCVHNNQCWKN